jgi:hypothetical protein
MKKFYVCLGIALLGVMSWRCNKSDDNNTETKAIALSAPADGQNYDLLETAEVSFSWSVTGTISGGYVLLLSKNADLTGAQTVEAASTSVSVSAATLETKLEAFGVAKGEWQKLYWSVKPAAASEQATAPAARAINLKRAPEPRYNLLLTAPADNAAFSSAAGAFVLLTFGWTVIDQVDAYTLKIAASEAGLATTTTTYDKGNSGGHAITTADELDALLQELGLTWGETATLWWTVVPTVANDAVDTYTRSFSATRRPQPAITLTAPADNASINAYTATFPVTFTWDKVTGVTAYTLKLSPTGDFTTAGAFVAFDAGDNNSHNLDKATCDGLLAQIATAAGSAYTGKATFQWTVEPTTAQPDIVTQTRTLVAIGGESAFPYELNADGANGDGWTVTASCASNGANVPGNILLTDGYWESRATMGDLGYSVILTIDMQKVKTVSKIEGQIRFAVSGTTVAVKKNEADDWTTAGPLNFAVANFDKKDLLLNNPVEARYIRIWITSAWQGEEWSLWLSFARVWVYGSNNGE